MADFANMIGGPAVSTFIPGIAENLYALAHSASSSRT